MCCFIEGIFVGILEHDRDIAGTAKREEFLVVEACVPRFDGIVLRQPSTAARKLPRREFFALCRARNIAVVFEDSDEYPLIEADTADFAYARLQRMREDVATGYDDAALDRFRRTRPKLAAGR